jgi:branched-chain amino acid aminotransferase
MAPAQVTEFPIRLQPIMGESRAVGFNVHNTAFGAVCTDHMLVAHYASGQWQEAAIQPYGNLSLSPSLSALHYGQSIFEGMKALRDVNGQLQIFRLEAHLDRLNRSAERLAMPPVPHTLFEQGLRKLIALDDAWVGHEPGSQLYIRPLLFATDDLLGVHVSERYMLAIMCCPVGPYYKNPIKVFVTDEYTRAAAGGVGFVKMAGNYARTMKLGQEAKQNGYDVVLWLDAHERAYVEEFSTMNAFFVLNDVVVTPPIGGTILEGITRDSALTLLRDGGFAIEERPVSIHELIAAGQNGTLTEAFGTGTAAVVQPVSSFTFRGQEVRIPEYSTWKAGPYVANRLRDIRTGNAPDAYQWLTTVQ